jgi:hypothetical protein
MPAGHPDERLLTGRAIAEDRAGVGAIVAVQELALDHLEVAHTADRDGVAGLEQHRVELAGE